MQKRIEYIDAMRGFTMLLVVTFHVVLFGYKQDFVYEHSFNAFFTLFRLPLFFFISGFLFYRREKLDTIGKCWITLRKKTIIQLVPTFIFLCVAIYWFDYRFVDAFCDLYKHGYWFTIALFEFFCLFILLNLVIVCTKMHGNIMILFLVGTALIIRVICSSFFWSKFGLDVSGLFDILGMSHMKYFLYFIGGVIVKDNYDKFNRLIQNKYFVTILILLFFMVVLIRFKEGLLWKSNVLCNHLILICCGGIGVILTFLFFQKNAVYFSKQTYLGRILQYIGRRTLDVYLLHYFFLPRGLQELGSYFETHQNYCIEFVISILISAIVVAICLLVSHVIRMSPVLGRLLFGAKDADSKTW